MFYYVYVLFFKEVHPVKFASQRFNRVNKFYTGYTKNLKLRLKQHQKGQVESTKNRSKFQLIYFEGCLNQQDATHREKYLKTYLGKMFLRNRPKSYLTG